MSELGKKALKEGKKVLNKLKKRLQRKLTMLLLNPYFWLVIAIFFILIIVVGTFIDIDSEDDSYSYEGYSEGTDWWWPIGSEETTTENGKLFASGDPAYSEITDTWGYQEWRRTFS